MSGTTVQAALLFNKKAKIINTIKDHIENGRTVQTVMQTTPLIPRMDIKQTHYPSTEERKKQCGGEERLAPQSHISILLSEETVELK